MRNRLMAVVEVLKWAEPHAWEDDEDDEGFGPQSPAFVASAPAESRC